MREHFDTVIVGTGLIGAAAARALSAAGIDVLAIGAREPTDVTRHAGPFASHHDAGRITRRLSADPVWSTLAAEAIARYVDLETASGIPFYTPNGCLYVAPPAQTATLRTAIAPQLAAGVAVTEYADGETLNSMHAPLAFPDHHQAIFEHAPAGMIDPRALVRAQLAVAAQQGALIRDDIVTGIKVTERGVLVFTGSGQIVRAGRALVTAGAYSNSYALLPRPLALRVKTETIILARVAPEVAAALAHLPAVVYAVEAAELNDIYMLPPLRYPDGQYYLKLGANTVADRTLPDLPAMQAWMREGESDQMLGALRAAVEAVLPFVPFEAFMTRRCLVTYSSHGYPMIDELVPERLFVATAGNGVGAKGSDTIGRLAADRLRNRWSSRLPAQTFRAVYADAPGSITNPMYRATFYSALRPGLY